MRDRRRTTTSELRRGRPREPRRDAVLRPLPPARAVRRRRGRSRRCRWPSRSSAVTPAAWTASSTARSRSSSPRRRTSPASSTRRSWSARASRRSYLEYLQMLTDVFAECVRKLEPGGRIAVNVANLGRKPYRSLSADVIRILEHDLGLLLRGELDLAEGARGERLVRVGLVPQRGEPGAPRPQRAGRSSPARGASTGARSVKQRAARGAAPREHADDRRLHGADARRLVDPAGERPAGRPPGARSRWSCPSS